jgi:lysozyme
MGWITNIFKKKPTQLKIEQPISKETTIKTFADISHYEKIDFDKYQPKILITKATEGRYKIDPTFIKIQAESKRRELKFGAYHFFRCNEDALTQAKSYCAIVKEFDMEPILDIEVLDGVSHEKCKEMIKIFLDYCEAYSGKVPMIYVSHFFIVELKLDDSFARYPLWLARYTNVTPKAPAPWSEWKYWQFSDREKFEGIGKCDSNVINEQIG